MIELTDEMRAAVRGRMGIPRDASLDPWMEAAIEDVLAIVERDHMAKPTCVCLGSDWPHVPSSMRCTPPTPNRDGRS